MTNIQIPLARNGIAKATIDPNALSNSTVFPSKTDSTQPPSPIPSVAPSIAATPKVVTTTGTRTTTTGRTSTIDLPSPTTPDAIDPFLKSSRSLYSQFQTIISQSTTLTSKRSKRSRN